jgi:hypothetical protein
MPFSYEKY